MNRHRIFIAINPPENVKKALHSYQNKWSDIPANWTRKDNLHITLLFLGYLTDQELLDVISDTERIIADQETFQINLNKIIFGPLKKMPPRMIWATGDKSKEFTKLQRDLENNLYSEPLPGTEKREKGNYFTPHITLARLKNWEFKEIEVDEMPEVNEDINLSFTAESIEIMESELKKGGPNYIFLESFNLKS